jgi:hypothetical protein
MSYEVKVFTNGERTIKTVKIGNTEFRVDNFKPKTKAEFVKKYEGFKQKVDKKEVLVNPWVFNRDEAWEFLKQFVTKDGK